MANMMSIYPLSLFLWEHLNFFKLKDNVAEYETIIDSLDFRCFTDVLLFASMESVVNLTEVPLYILNRLFSRFFQYVFSGFDFCQFDANVCRYGSL